MSREASLSRADVDGNPKSCSDRQLYVAATRARALLIVLEEARAA